MKFGARYDILLCCPNNANSCDISAPTLYISSSSKRGVLGRAMMVNRFRSSETVGNIYVYPLYV